jgi:hypothetical protein
MGPAVVLRLGIVTSRRYFHLDNVWVVLHHRDAIERLAVPMTPILGYTSSVLFASRRNDAGSGYSRLALRIVDGAMVENWNTSRRWRSCFHVTKHQAKRKLNGYQRQKAMI